MIFDRIKDHHLIPTTIPNHPPSPSHSNMTHPPHSSPQRTTEAYKSNKRSLHIVPIILGQIIESFGELNFRIVLCSFQFRVSGSVPYLEACAEIRFLTDGKSECPFMSFDEWPLSFYCLFGGDIFILIYGLYMFRQYLNNRI